DMFISPVPLSYVTVALSCLVANKTTGILQISGSTEVSYFFVASRLAHKMGVPSKLVKRVSMADSGLTLYRPNMHCSLSTKRIEADLGLTPPAVGDTV